MRTRFNLLVLGCQLILSLYVCGATTDDSWQNLNHVTRERYYTVMDRKSNCFTGHILAATDRAVTLKFPDASTMTFDRTKVLRVSVSQAAPYLAPNLRADVARVLDVIYNNKSSWLDIKGLAAQEKFGVSGQEVKVVNKNMKKYEGRLSTISDAQFELEQPNGKLEIPKADVAQVYYLRYKPLTDSEKYSAQEDFWIDPRLWPYYLRLVPKMAVRLYDWSLPQDDTPVKCEDDSKEKSASDLTCFSGTVESIDLPNITMLQPHNRTRMLQWNKETSVRKLATPVGIDKVQIGDHMIVCGSIENRAFVAKRITVIN